tara:strand:- start:9493 stop:9702 length:210 start_codon:yes stop_codon:yes gene_type:complete
MRLLYPISRAEPDVGRRDMSHGEGPERHNRIFNKENIMEHTFLLDILKWTLVSILIYWVLMEIFNNDID